MTEILRGLSELPPLARWPAEVAMAATICLCIAWWVATACAKRSAALGAHIWLVGFAAVVVWSGIRMAGMTILLPVLPADASPVLRDSSEEERQMEPSRPRVLVDTIRPATLEVRDRPAVVNSVPRALPSPPKPARMDWPRLVGALWLAGAGVVLFRILAGAILLKRALRSARPVSPGGALAGMVADLVKGDSQRLHVGLHPGVASPVSFGIRTWWILFPPEAEHWSATRLRLVLAHELAHCERRDHLSVLFLRLVTAACWFHPLAWFGLRRFRVLCESAADDRALEEVETSLYVQEVLSLVGELRGRPAFLSAAVLSIGQPATLRDRITAMLDPGRDRRRLPARVSLAVALVAVLFAVLLPGLRISRAEQAAPAPAASAAPPNSPAGLPPRPDTREVIISVRDELEMPVENAEVKLTGTTVNLTESTDEGTLYSIPTTSLEGAKTDFTGRAVLRFPSMVPLPQYPPGNFAVYELSARVSHPDFCILETELTVAYPEAPPERVELFRGPTVRVIQVLPKDVPSGWKACVELISLAGKRSAVEWLPLPGLAGVSSRVPPGDYAIRTFAFDDAGRRYFSAPARLLVRQGENQELKLTAEPGIMVRGQLAPEVPRPVTNGRVAVDIVSMPKVGAEGRVSWSAWAPIRPDGTFELQGLPKGEIQLTAGCDGYVFRNPRKPREARTGGYPAPQIFEEALAEKIVVAMEKSGTAKLKIVSPDGKPLRDVEVSFFGNEGFIYGYDHGAYLRWQLVEGGRGPAPASRSPRWMTDEAGLVTIPNLKSGSVRFRLRAAGWEMPVVRFDNESFARMGTIAIEGGETTSMTIRLEAKGTTSLREEWAKARSAGPKDENTAASETPAIDPSPSTGNRFPVAPGKDLVGRVVDESGAPLAGVLVDAWLWDPGNETKTDVDGRFLLRDLKRQSVEVQFSLAGFSPVHVTRQPIGTLAKDIVLAKRPYFEGVVTDSQGRPVADQLIRATCGSNESDIGLNNYWCETRTDREGHYQLHVFPETYRLEVRSAAGEVARLPGQTIARNETRPLDIKLSPGLTFRALAVDSITGGPVSGVRLSHWQHPGVEGTSDANGQIAIAGMFPGDFTFEVDAEKQGYRRWWSQDAEVFNQRRYMEQSGWQRNFNHLQFVVTQQARTVRIEMEKGVRVRGVVRSPDGKPVKEATVTTGFGGGSLTGDSRFSVRSQEDGRFEALLPASNDVKYNLVAHDGRYRQWRDYANGVLPSLQTKPGGEIDGVEIFLSLPCVVRGRVVDPKGNAVAGWEVQADATDLLENAMYGPRTRTKPDGSFEFRFLRAGKQLIQAEPSWPPQGAAPGTWVEVEASPERIISDVVLTARFAK